MEFTSLGQFCRLCLQQHPHYLSLFDKKIKTMLESLTSIKVSITNTVSTLVCPRCFSGLEQAYLFQQKLIKTEKALHAKISSVLAKSGKTVNGFSHKEENVSTGNLLDDLANTINVTKTNSERGKLVEDLDAILMKYQCAKCPETFYSTDDYVSHLDIHRTKYCKFCAKDIQIDDYEKHRKVHTPGKCEFCGIKLKNNHSLRNHISRVHSGPNVICETCGVVSYNDKLHNLHIRKMHTGDATHICDTCGVKLFSLSALNKHQMVHATEKPFVCDVCDKAYAIKSKLKVHQLRHSDKMLFICKFCGKGFKFKGNLKVHLKSVHDWVDEQNYKCDICNVEFHNSRALGGHMRTHTLQVQTSGCILDVSS